MIIILLRCKGKVSIEGKALVFYLGLGLAGTVFIAVKIDGEC